MPWLKGFTAWQESDEERKDMRQVLMTIREKEDGKSAKSTKGCSGNRGFWARYMTRR